MSFVQRSVEGKRLFSASIMSILTARMCRVVLSLFCVEGLGKSMQVIFFLGHLRAHRVFGPFLIVAPLGTLPAWRDETKRWTPNTPVLVYHGDKATRANLRKQFLSATIDETFPVVVTSFEIAMADAAFLKRMHWKLLTVDEGHRLKNMESLLLQKLKSFPSENRLLLTGSQLNNETHTHICAVATTLSAC